jgi:hypothetical protein
MAAEKKDFSAGASTSSDGCSNIYQNLSQSALSSMEQFLTAIRIEKGHPESAQTPGFRPPSVSDEGGNFGDGAVGPTLHELDPYFPQGIITDDPDGARFMEENDYRIVLNSKVNKADTTGDFNLRKLEDEAPGSRADIDWVQPMNALRGPLIMSGWGFGMDDLPVPQEGSTFPENTKFDQDMFRDRSQWKTGPVHLMWDDERQVWQGGYPIVCGVVDGSIEAPVDVCTPTQFTVNLFRNTQHMGGNLSDAITPKETITVQNRDPSLEQDATPNAIFCIAIKLNYEWLPLWVGCPEDPACGKESQPEVPPCISNSTCP